MGAIVDSGQAYIAANTANGSVNVIEFVLANIPGLDPASPVNLAEVWPSAGFIVDTVPVTQSGFINPGAVVYSILLGSDVGDYDFNWIGLKADDGTLVAVSYAPTQEKRKTVVGLTGNNLARSFLLEFADAQSATNITIDASTWQIDFTGRLNTIDEQERAANADLYGRQLFFDAGWEVWNDAGVFKVKTGVGYVDGIRIESLTQQTVTPGVLPKDVWLDVSLQGGLSGVSADVQLVFNNADQANYVDGSNRQHYLIKIATIAAGGAVADLRNVHTVGASVVDYLKSYTDNEVSRIKGGVSENYDTLSELEEAIIAVANSLGNKSDDGHAHDERYARIEKDLTMVFYEATAPNGWSINTDGHDVGLKVVSSTPGGSIGGSMAFSSVFSASRSTTSAGSHNHSITVGGRSLTIAQMPYHRIPITIWGDNGNWDPLHKVSGNMNGYKQSTGYTQYVGSGLSHDHAGSSTSVGNHAHSMNLNLKFAAVLLCDRD